MSIWKLFHKHLPALCIAIVIGIATGAPQFYVIHEMDVNYGGIFPEIGNDDRYYMSRSHEVRDGFPMLGNPYIYELRDAPSVSFWMPDAALSYAGEILGLDVPHTFAFFNFVLPPVLFLLSYAILLRVMGKQTAALLGAAVFHLGLFLTTFSRSPSPQLNFIFIELAILFLLALIQNRSRAYVAALGCTLGALFYVYPYYWTFAYGAIGTFFLIVFLQRQFREHALHLFVALIGGVILGLPALLRMIQMTHIQAYRDTVYRLGLIESHAPTGLLSIVFVALLCFVFSIILYFLPSKRKDPYAWLFVSMAVGGIFVENTQILTGKNGEFSAHYYLPIVYVVFLGAVYFLSLLLDVLSSTRKEWAQAAVCGVAIGICIVGATNSIIPRLKQDAGNISIQKYGTIIRWLNANTAPESVVFAGEELSSLIPAYTSDRIFYSRNANLHIMTDQEAWTRFLLEYRDADLTDDFLTAHIGPIWGAQPYDEYGHQLQLNKFRSLVGLPITPVQLLPDASKTKFRIFATQLQNQSVEKLLGDRRIDYVVSGPDFIQPKWLTQRFPQIEPVYASNGMTIFKLTTGLDKVPN